MKELILKIEDMLLDFRSTNAKAMADDTQTVVNTTCDLLDHYPVSRTRSMYKRYQAMWLEYARKNQIDVDQCLKKDKMNKQLDTYLTQFFIELGLTYAPSTLYVVFSCVNHLFITKHGIKLNKLLKLNRYLKAVTSSYVCKKSKVFSAEEIDNLLNFCMESEDPFHTTIGVGVSLMYYGLLRCSDVLKIRYADVQFDKKGRIEVSFDHARKRKNPGFTYLIPSLYGKLFQKYNKQLPESILPSDTYLRKYVKQFNCRKTVLGPRAVSKFVNICCEILHRDPVGYTGHAFRRSAATNLADAGVSFVNLKRHGQWKSDSVAEGYIANSKALQNERLEFLLPPIGEIWLP